MGRSPAGEESLGEFVAQLASSAPTPGGGGAAALVGALAAALAAMVGELTLGRPRLQAAEPEVRRLLERLARCRADLMELIDQDALAYQAVAAAYALPRTTAEEVAARTQVVNRALHEAIAPPERIATSTLEVLRAARTLAEIGNPALASDAGCAALLGEACVRCATLNVLANVVLLRDDADNATARDAAEARDREAAELCAATLRLVAVRLGA